MKEIFFSMPLSCICVMAVLYAITLRISWSYASIVAKFMLNRKQNKFGRPDEEDEQRKNYIESVLLLVQLVFVLIMLIHLIRNCGLWNYSSAGILLMLLKAFLPLAAVIVLSVYVVGQVAIKHYLKQHL